MRVIDLPADAGVGMGLLEHVPVGLTPGAFADRLKQAAATHYGHALTAFVSQLVKDRETLTQYLRKAGTPSPSNCVQVSRMGKFAAWRNGSPLLPLPGNWPPLSG